jgi:hypothetical protein
MISWENIKIFYLINKYNSFQLAAKFLQTHVSSLSRRIKFLEKELNKPLFIKKKNIELTIFGNFFLTYIKTSCDTILNFKIDTLNKNLEIKIYISDIYYYNLLLDMYYKKYLDHNFDIHNISIMSLNSVNHLMDNNIKNFIYISAINIAQSSRYISWPLFKIPLYLYKNTKHQKYFFAYNGKEDWLKNIHQKYLQDNNIKDILYSNSIDIIIKLLHQGGQTILPNLYTDYNSDIDKSIKLYEQQLFFTFHEDNNFIKKIFFL